MLNLLTTFLTPGVSDRARHLAGRLLSPTGALWHSPPPIGTDALQRLVKELTHTIEILRQGQPSSASGAEWTGFCNELAEQLTERQPLAFLRCPVIGTTMFVANPAYIERELMHLRASPKWKPVFRSALQETRIGNPQPLWLYPRSSGNTVHHVYHICRLMEVTGAEPAGLQSVFEFGGGYGNMARLLPRLGFGGHHIIYDLPHFSALQRFYPSAVGMAVSGDLSFSANTYVISNETAAKRAFAQMDTPGSLFIATWSLSEAPLSTRAFVEPYLNQFQYLLISYQHAFGGVDNARYFSDMKTRLAATHDCVGEEIEHLVGNSYFFACAKRPMSY